MSRLFSGSRSPLRLFQPILAGASIRERLLACLGALLSLVLTALVSGLILSDNPFHPLLLAPVGGSAILLFAVPTSPLAQPWPIVGGNAVSALVGLAVSLTIQDAVLAPAAALTFALAAMSFLRCLHPPAGAAAVAMTLGVPVSLAAHLSHEVAPLLINVTILVVCGWGFHRVTGRAYPHRAALPPNPRGTSDIPPQLRTGIQPEDIDGALERLGETFDIDRGDLERLMREVELQSVIRSHGRLSCADLMSRDVIGITPETSADGARELILRHGVRALPVMDDGRHLLGVVGLRELFQEGGAASDLMVAAKTAAPQDDALALIPALTDGKTHAVVIVDGQDKVVGLLSQTDLLVALARKGRRSRVASG